MSYLEKYLEKHRLDRLSKKQKKKLENLESKLDATTQKQTGLNFEDIIKEHAEKIIDLVERLELYFQGWEFSLGNMYEAVRFVYSIAMEVSQIVNEIEKDLKLDGLSSEEAYKVKVEFGTELTVFVWNLWDPLKDVAGWLPFRKTLEEMVIRWLAEMAIKAALDFLGANKTVGAMSVGKKGNKNIVKVFMKAF